MKIATFNVNSVRMRLPIVIDWLAQNKPDVLCLQETKVQDPDFPLEAFAETGYRVAFKGMKAYNGVAMFTKEKPEFVSFGLGDGPEADEPRLGHIRIDGIDIINTYIPQGYLIESPKYTYKLAWYKRLKAYFEKNLSPQKPAIWCGDMNVAPENQDVHHPEDHLDHVCFHKDVQAAYRDTLAWGWTDTFRKLYPDRVQYTFWDYRFRRGQKSAVEANLGWRIDHILVTAPLLTCLQEVAVDMAPRMLEKASDHTVLWASFDPSF